MEATRTAHLGTTAENPAAAQTKHVNGQSSLACHENALPRIRRKKMRKYRRRFERREYREGAIESIKAEHHEPRSRYDIRKGRTYWPAKMTLWARTDNGDRVWLETKDRLNTASVESKIREYENENQHLVGRIIRYALSENREVGFVREFLDSDSTTERRKAKHD
jgi:hypothetical protein